MEQQKNIMLDDMVPAQIVKELDKYIIGQDKAKRTIAVALRNRTRRKRLPEGIRDEVSPKNIIMIGPTGVGKTEIARRIARLSNAPFIKVEATKYTEVGYVGRDVESMIRDLMGIAVQMVKKEMALAQEDVVKRRVEDRLIDLLLPDLKKNPPEETADGGTKDIVVSGGAPSDFSEATDSTKEKFRRMLQDGKFDDKEVEITAAARSQGIGIEMMGSGNLEDIQDAMNSLGSIFGNKAKRRKVTIRRAREIFNDEEMEKSVDQDRVIDEAKERTEQMGIVFIDEIDKIAGTNGASSGPDVSRQGVQRDILPIVEGTKVSTKWGIIDTTHILFIAAGAFHISKPSDLIPELQGRFPLRTELDDLKTEDFFRILKEPENAITKQYHELLKTEGVDVRFTDDAINRISEIAWEVNSTSENIGARRLYTIMELLLEELSFSASELAGQTVTITPAYVDQRLNDIVSNQDLSRYIL
ncbi:MAG: ATP-dependent protease ATPase subunit HslU [Sphaerochaetaceae bacterium]|nr:ATP-dependent protease ATPase subunit HslU [Sphaerochaetaceae bacterium]